MPVACALPTVLSSATTTVKPRPVSRFRTAVSPAFSVVGLATTNSTSPVGVAASSTVTGTAADVVGCPAVSVAVAVIEWPPGEAAAEFQVTEYGAELSEPTGVPSTAKLTEATPTSSEADADSVTGPETTAPDAGAVTLTDGGLSVGGGPAVQLAVLHETAASNRAQPFAVNVAGPLANSGNVSRQAGAAAPVARAAPGAITNTDASVPARATTVAEAAGRPHDSRPRTGS